MNIRILFYIAQPSITVICTYNSLIVEMQSLFCPQVASQLLQLQIHMLPFSSDSRKQSVVMKQLRGICAALGLAVFTFANRKVSVGNSTVL